MPLQPFGIYPLQFGLNLLRNLPRLTMCQPPLYLERTRSGAKAAFGKVAGDRPCIGGGGGHAVHGDR